MKTASEDQVERRSSCHKEWILKFLRSPLEVLSAPGEDRVTGIKLGLNQLQVKDCVLQLFKFLTQGPVSLTLVELTCVSNLK